jgi:hypothetical protein
VVGPRVGGTAYPRRIEFREKETAEKLNWALSL